MQDIFDMFSLKGKKAVITGGTGVLGSTIAKGLGEAGATVAICYHRRAPDEVLDELKAEGIEAKAYHVDVTDPEKVKVCRDQIMKDMEKVDVLLNAAGGNIKEATTSSDLSFFDVPLSALHRTIALNLFGGAILPSQAFGKAMVGNKQGGCIVNVSSMNSYRPLTRVLGYSAAKAAVNNFTQWLAVHFAKQYNKNVRVNAIAPGFFLTPQNRYLLLDEQDNFTPRGKTIIDHTPMGEFGKPQDLIGVCIWLASSAARFVTGTVIPIDGGFNAYSGV